MNYILEYPGSAFLYFLMLLSSVFFAFLAQTVKSRRVGNIFVFLIILILAIPSGLRGESVGIDTWNYMRAINSIGASGEPFYTYFEIGFQLILKTLLFLVGSHYVLLVISLVTNALIIRTLWFFKDKISFSLSVFLYFVMHYFETYNISRQWLAIAIVFFAVRYLFEMKYLKFALFVTVAVSIHGSSIICLAFVPMHMLMVKRSPLKYRILMVLAVVVFALYSNYLLDILGVTSTIDKYQYYLQEGNPTLGIGFLSVVRLFATLIAIWLLVTNKYKFEDVNFAKSIIMLTFLGTVSSMLLGYLYFFAGRLSAFAIVYDIVLLSMMTKSRHFSILIKIAVILLGLYLLYTGLKESSQGQMPYKLFFSK